MKQLRSQPATLQKRRAVAAVEMAIALPLLVLLLLGTIDLGQFVNVGQVVSNASRVGARKASVKATKTVADVEAEVINYLDHYFPGRSTSEIQNATTVSVMFANGTALSGNDLAFLEDGVKMIVTVQFDYSAVRWVNGITQLDNRPLTVATTIRRL